MKFATIVSEKDPAGLNIKDSLIKLFGFKELDEKFEDSNIYQLKDNIKLYTTKKESIYCENIDKDIKADLFVFATKHQSAKGVHSLSCHVPGNWSKAEFGGIDRKLCVAPASYLKEAFLILNKLGKDLDYEITLECTHHGPFVSKPIMFIEIGSSKEQWINKKAGDIIAKTIIELLEKQVRKYKAVLVLGGCHYNHTANKVMLDSDYTAGHICPKHMLQYLNKDMLQQAIDKTLEEVNLIILDWKGLGQYKQDIIKLLTEIGLEYKKVKEILKKPL